MVTGLSIETLLPRAAGEDGYINRFLTVWKPDEQGHAIALERLLVVLDIEPFPLPQDEPVPLHNRLAGLLGTLSSRMHETVELIYHTIGAMNEKLAFSAYERMSDVLVELEEHALVDTLLQHLRRDESAHLGYYRTAARDLRDRLDHWQLTVARQRDRPHVLPGGSGGPAGQARASAPRCGRSAIATPRPSWPTESSCSPRRSSRWRSGGCDPSWPSRSTAASPPSAPSVDRPWPAWLAMSRRSKSASPKMAKIVP